MKESSKRVWTVRLLALLVMSFGFSLLISTYPENIQSFTKRVEIRAKEDVGDIVTAVEQLNRDDIHISIKDVFWYGRKPRFLWGGIGFFLGFSFFLGIYYTIYCMTESLLNRIESRPCKPKDEQKQ